MYTSAFNLCSNYSFWQHLSVHTICCLDLCELSSICVLLVLLFADVPLLALLIAPLGYIKRFFFWFWSHSYTKWNIYRYKLNIISIGMYHSSSPHLHFVSSFIVWVFLVCLLWICFLCLDYVFYFCYHLACPHKMLVRCFCDFFTLFRDWINKKLFRVRTCSACKNVLTWSIIKCLTDALTLSVRCATLHVHVPYKGR